MNRQQRRSAMKVAGRGNGHRSAPTQEMGRVFAPVDPPEVVGEISVAEATEIKARQGTARDLAAEIADLERRLGLLRRLQTISGFEQQHFVQGLVRARNLGMDDGYQVEPDSGQILRVQRALDAEVAAPALAAVPDAGDEAAPDAEPAE